MLRFMMLFCLCLFPFLGAWCEKQAAAEAPGASALAIWGGNGDESLSSVYRTSEGDVVLLAQTDSTSGTPALSSHGGRDERRLDSARFQHGRFKIRNPAFLGGRAVHPWRGGKPGRSVHDCRGIH